MDICDTLSVVLPGELRHVFYGQWRVVLGMLRSLDYRSHCGRTGRARDSCLGGRGVSIIAPTAGVRKEEEKLLPSSLQPASKVYSKNIVHIFWPPVSSYWSATPCSQHVKNLTLVDATSTARYEKLYSLSVVKTLMTCSLCVMVLTPADRITCWCRESLSDVINLSARVPSVCFTRR